MRTDIGFSMAASIFRKSRQKYRLLSFIGLGIASIAFAVGVLAFFVNLWRKKYVPKSVPLPPPFDAPTRTYASKYGHITYQVVGKEGPPALVLHGIHALGSSFEMRRTVEALQNTHTVYVLDMLGFGRSARPNLQYSGGLYVELIRSFITEVISRPTLVIARSLSAVYAVAVAIRRPDLIQSIVLINPAQVDCVYQPPTFLDRLSVPFMRFPVFGVARFEQSVSYDSIIQHLSVHIFGSAENLSDEFVEYAFATSHQTGAEFAPGHMVTGHLALPGRLEDFRRLSQPTLVIWGPRTSRSNPAAASWLTDHPMVEVAIMHDCGEMPHEEDPEQFASILHSFLSRVQENGSD